MNPDSPMDRLKTYMIENKDVSLVTGLVFIIGLLASIYGIIINNGEILALGMSVVLGSFSGTMGGLFLGRPFGWVIGLLVGLFGGVYLGLFINDVGGAYTASFGGPVSGVFSGWWAGLKVGITSESLDES